MTALDRNSRGGSPYLPRENAEVARWAVLPAALMPLYTNEVPT
jgi:hypothetical protein